MQEMLKDPDKWLREAERLNVGQTNTALAAANEKMPSKAVQDKLLELYPVLTTSLASALEARLKSRVDGLQKRLAERADKEANDIEAILTELKNAIESELDEPEYQQLQLFSDPEREQFERNKNAMRARVQQIPGEIERETAAIRARFANPQARMFPVAVTFLVPERFSG